MEKEDQSQKLNFLNITIKSPCAGKMSLKYIAKMQQQMSK